MDDLGTYSDLLIICVQWIEDGVCNVPIIIYPTIELIC